MVSGPLQTNAFFYDKFSMISSNIMPMKNIEPEFYGGGLREKTKVF